MNNALIIFVRNPVLGKVKTRLAATVGNETALQVYKQLLHYTLKITQGVQADKFVFYDEEILEEDMWRQKHYYKFLQNNGDLGTRMVSAFEQVFGKGYCNICVIGSDCFELTTGIIEDAFSFLEKKDVVIGPAKDGGYYLLGMKEAHTELFRDKKWSTSSVLEDTIRSIRSLGLTFAELPALSDIDEADDLVAK